MDTVSRREILYGGSLAGLAAFLPPRLASAAQLRTRHNVANADGRRMLDKYARAVAQMTGRGGGDPTSWLFQWYIHAVPYVRDGSPATKQSEVQRVFGAAASPAKDLALAVWETCQAHFTNTTDMFLPWHRMYLLAFEEVVRGVLADDDFTLPYWDYTSSGGQALPEAFRKPNHPLYGTLFRQNRKKTTLVDINAGDAMDKGLVRSPYHLQAMRQPSYGGDFGFCTILDGTLHGSVHTGVGDGTNMGRVPFAAGDPIFWLHHANIDRIWAGWNGAGGLNPPLSGSFSFAGRDGRRVDFDASQILSTTSAGYEYDALPTPPATAIRTAGGAAAPSRTLAAAAGPVSLGDGAVEIPLAPQTSTSFTTAVSGGGAAQRLYVVLGGLSARAQPGVLYEVFLNLPAGADAATKRRHYVGTVNFFGAPSDTQRDHQPRRTIVFDVTDNAAALQASAEQPGGQPRLSIIPVEPPTPDSRPIIEAVSVVRR